MCEDWRKPLIRCTPGEKSHHHLELIFQTPNGKKIIHNMFDCSETYARAAMSGHKNKLIAINVKKS